MVLSSLFFLDLKGKILISRDYRGDISPKYAEEFIDLLSEREIAMEMDENCEGQVKTGNNSQPPIFHRDGINYCYMKHNNLYCKHFSFLGLIFYILFSACNDEKKFQCDCHFTILTSFNPSTRTGFLLVEFIFVGI